MQKYEHNIYMSRLVTEKMEQEVSDKSFVFSRKDQTTCHLKKQLSNYLEEF